SESTTFFSGSDGIVLIVALPNHCRPSQIWIRTPKADCGEMKYWRSPRQLRFSSTTRTSSRLRRDCSQVGLCQNWNSAPNADRGEMNAVADPDSYFCSSTTRTPPAFSLA